MTGAAGAAGPVKALGTAYTRVRWFWRGVTGADAYDRYCDHLRRTHPDRPVPTAREFWRQKYEEQERNPRTRCC